MSTPHLLVFGPGYSAKPVMERAKNNGWTVTASARSKDKAEALREEGYGVLNLYARSPSLPADVTHILTSVAPPRDGSTTDPVLDRFAPAIRGLSLLQWIGYLSATNVYGDHDGDWVDESTPPTPGLDRGRRRLDAEALWWNLAADMTAACHIFRLAGIYGPGRNPVKSLLDGTARRVHKPGQFFSRIHVDDIAGMVWCAAQQADLGSQIFNAADDEPLAPDDAVTRTARALGVEPPPLVPFEDADMSPMARSFYEDNKRVKNGKLKSVLGYELRYPTLDSALGDLIHEEAATRR